MNAGLDAAPGWTLFAFVLIDMGSALCLYALFAAAKVPVDADFALAYAVSKSIRAPRLALGAFCFLRRAGSRATASAIGTGSHTTPLAW